MKKDSLCRKSGHYELRGIRAIDGDTLEAILCLPFDALVRKRIRLQGWWAPELNGQWPSNGEQAKAALQKFVESNVCTVFSKSERLDKYGRIIGVLYASGRVVEPMAVIGLWQLTPELHKQDADWIKLQSLRPAALNKPAPAAGSYQQQPGIFAAGCENGDGA